jgi:integral membrane sensor domain MASE1
MQPILQLSVTRILFLAIAYYVLAQLVLLLAIAPGYATAIWLPSGLAIAAVLLWGYPLIAGVFLGSFAVNLGIRDPLAELELPAIALPAAIACGSALQAALGKCLVERFCTVPWTLRKLSQTLWLVGLGGAVASIGSASVRANSLLYFGLLQPQHLAISGLRGG